MKKIYRNSLSKICYRFVLLCVCVYPSANFAAEEDIAGRIVAVSGQVTAIDTTGSSRSLSRRSEIFVGDTVVTQPDAFAQIRMTDSALVSLKASTQFEIVAYSYEQDIDNDVISMRLIEGGFRTITGSIGAQNRNAYNVETELSNIGIRGTDHEAVLDGGLYVAVYDGATQLNNTAGSLDLGVGADFDFGVAFDDLTPPQGLLLQPDQLGNIPVLTVAQLEETDNDDDGDGDGADGNSAADGNLGPRTGHL